MRRIVVRHDFSTPITHTEAVSVPILSFFKELCLLARDTVVFLLGGADRGERAMGIYRHPTDFRLSLGGRCFPRS